MSDEYVFRGGYIEDPAGDRWWSAGLLKKVETERDEARAELKKTEDDFQSVFDSRDEVIRERERARQACNTYWHDLTRIALLCAQTDDEYPLKAVERVLKERDELLQRVETLRELADRAAYEQGVAQRRMTEAQTARDNATFRARRACQLLIEEVGADGPTDVDEVADRAAVLIRELRDQVNDLRAAAEESEHQMHLRVRAGYDKTIADCWRAKVAEVERERDGAKAEAERMRDERDYWERRFEYADAHLSEAFNLSPMDNLPSGEAKRIVDLLRTERDEARAETQRLIELNRSHVATLCEAQRNQVEVLKAENERLQRLLDHSTQSNPGTSVLVMLMNEAKDAKKDYESLEYDAARVVLAHRHGDTIELDEAVEQLKSNGRDRWWESYKPIGLRGEEE